MMDSHVDFEVWGRNSSIKYVNSWLNYKITLFMIVKASVELTTFSFVSLSLSVCLYLSISLSLSLYIYIYKFEFEFEFCLTA